MLPQASTRCCCRNLTDPNQHSGFPLAITNVGASLWPHQCTSQLPGSHEQVLDHPKFLADGKVNPPALMSNYVLVFIQDTMMFKAAGEHVEPVRTVMEVLQHHSVLINMSNAYGDIWTALSRSHPSGIES